MRVIRIVRLSMKEKNQDHKAMRRQIFMVNQATQKIGGTLDDELYFESIVSGRKEDREDLEEIFTLIKSGRIDAIVINRIDRISRDTEQLMKLGKLLEKHRILTYECLKGDFIDFKNPDDWEHWGRASLNAEMESRRISVRLRQVHEFARFEERANNLPPFGYRKVGDKYVLDNRPYEFPDGQQGSCGEAARKQVEIFLREKRVKTTITQISLEIGKQWTPSGFGNWIRNETLRGHTRYRVSSNGKRLAGDVRYNTHPKQRLISEKEWEEIEKLLQDSPTLRIDRSHAYDLSGLTRCVRCGYGMRIHKSYGRLKKGETEKPIYYHVLCSTYRDKVHGKGCGSREEKCGAVPLWKIRDAVIDTLISRAVDLAEYEISKTREEETDPEILRIQGQISQVEALIKSMGDRNGFLLAQIRSLEQEVESRLNEPSEVSEEERLLLIEAGSSRSFWQELDEATRRTLFQTFVRVVSVDPVAREVVDVELKI